MYIRLSLKILPQNNTGSCNVRHSCFAALGPAPTPFLGLGGLFPLGLVPVPLAPFLALPQVPRLLVHGLLLLVLHPLLGVLLFANLDLT